jgi:hypothetical protein
MNDVQMIARLSSLIVAALKAPMPDSAQLSIFAAVLDDAGAGDAFGLPACAGASEASADTATLHSAG